MHSSPTITASHSFGQLGPARGPWGGQLTFLKSCFAPGTFMYLTLTPRQWVVDGGGEGGAQFCYSSYEKTKLREVKFLVFFVCLFLFVFQIKG